AKRGGAPRQSACPGGSGTSPPRAASRPADPRPGHRWPRGDAGAGDRSLPEGGRGVALPSRSGARGPRAQRARDARAPASRAPRIDRGRLKRFWPSPKNRGVLGRGEPPELAAQKKGRPRGAAPRIGERDSDRPAEGDAAVSVAGVGAEEEELVSLFQAALLQRLIHGDGDA